jgi:uncharacterized membrane protein (DUF106 family)
MLLYVSLIDNIQLALTIILFVWIYNWAKGNVGSAKLAFVTALLIVFLTFYSFPELIWLLVIIWTFATFGKDLIGRASIFEK